MTRPAAKSADRGIFPLSLEQEWFYALRLLCPNQRLSLTLTSRIRGPLDTRAFLGAIGMLFERHSALRARLAFTDRGEPRQSVLPSASMAPVTCQAVASVSPQQFDAYVRRAAVLDRKSRWNPVRDPLCRLRLLRYAADEHVLIGTFDRLAFDQRALLIFERDLWLAYLYLRGEPGSQPPAGSDLAEAVSRQRRHHEERAATINSRFWAEQYALAPPTVHWPATSHSPLPAASGSQDLVQHAIDKELAARIEEVSGATGRTPVALCATAFAELAFQQTAQDRIAIYVTVDTRERNDESVIAMFTSTRPLVIGRSADPQAQVADQLSRAHRHRHLHGQALANLESAHRDRFVGPQRHDLLVDYAADGRAAVAAARPAELDVSSAGDSGPPGTAISLALLYRQAGTSVRMGLCYDPALVSGTVAAKLSGLLSAQVSRLDGAGRHAPVGRTEDSQG